MLLRHGQSEWNHKNLFTGWKDPDLTLKGVEEARAAGRCLKAHGYFFDRAFTSNLVRAQHTLQLVLAELGTPYIEVIRDQALNERDYGVLCGLNKDDAIRKWGGEQVELWRRSYDIRPPGGESLKDTVARVLPCYCQRILPLVLGGQRVIVAAHGNSLRADGARANWRNAKHAAQWEATLATYAEPIIGALPVQVIDTTLA